MGFPRSHCTSSCDSLLIFESSFEQQQAKAVFKGFINDITKEHCFVQARAIQFFTPGMPMVYYNGLLAGLNDFKVTLNYQPG